MIGIIVSGHAKFASGLSEALKLIAGEQENYIAIDFDDDVNKLQQDLTNAFDQLSSMDNIIVLCDLPGGSPFKVAATLAQNKDNIKVIGGVNMPMLAEVAMARNIIDDFDELLNQVMNTGKEQILKFEIKKRENNDLSDGI